MAYLWFKSFHIIGFVAWFAGLFYLPRLFIYHIEADERPEPIRAALKEEYSRIEKLLYRLIIANWISFLLWVVNSSVGERNLLNQQSANATD